LLRPESGGYLTLRSRDPFTPPLIQPNYLTSAADMDVLVQGIVITRRLARTPAFAAVLGDEIQPGPAVQRPAELHASIRSHAATVYHPVGTLQNGQRPAGGG
jgi:choline dehydrogenase